MERKGKREYRRYSLREEEVMAWKTAFNHLKIV
jgi:hypothetical protein